MSILKQIDSGSYSAGSLERLMEADPAITAKVLKVVQTAQYGGQDVQSIARAIQLLGSAEIKRIVLGISFQQSVFEESGESAYEKLEYWRHSYAVAVAAREISRQSKIGKPDELFVAGLMHDLGMLVIERFAFAHCRAALILAKRDQCSLAEAERRVLGWDHCDAGKKLAEMWKLPRVVGNAMQFHHNPGLDGEEFESTCIITLADVLAYNVGFNIGLTILPPELDVVAQLTVNLSQEDMDAISAKVVEEVMRAEQEFGIR